MYGFLKDKRMSKKKKKPIIVPQNVTANVTVGATENAMSVGPIIVDSGVTITVSNGARYVVI